MLYAPTTNKEHIPLGWEEAEYLFKKLQVLCLGTNTHYQHVWERRMLFNSAYPEIRAQIIKWTADVKGNKRELVAEAYSCAEIVPVLIMLIAVADDERKARGLPQERATWD